MRLALRRMGELIAPIRLRLLLGLITALATSILALMIPQVLEHMVNSDLRPGGPVAIVWTGAALVLGLGVLEALMLFLRRVFVLGPATGVEKQLRGRLHTKIQSMPVAFHDRWGSGQLLSRVMTDTNMLRRWIAFGMIMGVTTAVTAVVGVALLMKANVWLALIFVAAAIPIMVVSYRFNRRYSVLSRLSQDQAGDLATTVEQSVQGIRVLKAFGRGPSALEKFTDQAGQLRGTEVQKATTLAWFDTVVFTLPEIATGISLLLGLHLTANGQMSVGELAAYFTTAVLVTGPVRMLGQILGMFTNAATALDRHFDVMDAPNPITSPAHPKELADQDVQGRVVLEGVRFRYPDSPERMPDLIRGADLEIRPRETLALVGVTGSGKSTLLQLVGRLYDVTGGRILLDGIDIRDLALPRLHELTGFAFEDPTLFSDSVRENVLIGADPSLSPDQLQDLLDLALRTADASFAYELPEGVDTRIGEEGLSLSGGQRQRLALARAIAARPAVLLLDDPLSALDTKTEEHVTQRLREVLASTTTLIVAHRTSTVALADRVALLDEGRIVAVGTHEELMAASERYRFVIADHEAEAEGEVTIDTLTGELPVFTGEIPEVSGEGSR